MQNLRADKLKNWLAKAKKSKISELVGFMDSIKMELKAVEAAFSS